jgi:molybdate transport system substrate-binding protein
VPLSRFLLLTLVALLRISPSHAESAAVAVAANFHAPMLRLATTFEQETNHEINVISGSTGGLYAQIINGAPYDLYIAADSHRPTLLAASGVGVASSQSTIAIGELVLWSADASRIADHGLDLLQNQQVRFLAIANPAVAPYGNAAKQALRAMGLWDLWESRLAYGTSIAQAYAMVATRNAELGLIARSQVLANPNAAEYVLIPQEHYSPIRQDAILLARGAENPAAVELLEYLSSTRAQTMIRSLGYRIAR